LPAKSGTCSVDGGSVGDLEVGVPTAGCCDKIRLFYHAVVDVYCLLLKKISQYSYLFHKLKYNITIV